MQKAIVLLIISTCIDFANQKPHNHLLLNYSKDHSKDWFRYAILSLSGFVIGISIYVVIGLPLLYLIIYNRFNVLGLPIRRKRTKDYSRK